MWYWILRFEGLLLLPVAFIYYKLRGIPFTARCRKCQRWLLDPASFRGGFCESCHKERLSDMIAFYAEQYQSVEPPARLAPDNFYPRVVKRIGNGKVLDVGCGLGYLLSRVKLPKELLYGMDVGPGALKVAREWVGGGNFWLANVTNIPCQSATFDYLVCTEVLEHLTAGQGELAVRECFRVLKPGGTALFTVPNGRGVLGDYFCAHIRFFSFASVTGLLRAVGFEVVSGQKFGLYLPLVSRFIGFVYNAQKKYVPVTPMLNLNVPEFLSLTFFIECRKRSELSSQV
jgi:ubiquinone/menaquinone biosynthesis C-methylase UbiE